MSGFKKNQNQEFYRSLIHCVRFPFQCFPVARNASCSSLISSGHDAEQIMIIHGARVLLSTASSMHYVESSSNGNKRSDDGQRRGSADGRRRLRIDSNVYFDYLRQPVQSRSPKSLQWKKITAKSTFLLLEERKEIFNKINVSIAK